MSFKKRVWTTLTIQFYDQWNIVEIFIEDFIFSNISFMTLQQVEERVMKQVSPSIYTKCFNNFLPHQDKNDKKMSLRIYLDMEML